MKKKSTSKSKDHDKNKDDESKSHKHSRRKRRSSSSESDADSVDVQNEVSEDKIRRTSRKSEKDNENNAAGGARITRHSKRLAAISASSDDAKESTPELLSPAKTGKSSPYSSSSPSKESKKDGTPDKHRVKDINVWKVKSANGAGCGELQKLKICRQRSPENIPTPSESEVNNKTGIQDGETEESTKDNVGMLFANVTHNNSDIDTNTIPLPSDENVSNIQLPPSDFTDELSNLLSFEESNKLVVQPKDVTEESEKTNENVEIECEVLNVKLPPEPGNVVQKESELETVIQEPHFESVTVEKIKDSAEIEQSVSIAVQEEAGMKTQAELPIMESTTVAETGTSEISVETKVCSEIPTEIEDDIQIATNKNDDSESAAETDNNSEVVTETEKGSQAVTEVEDALQAVTEGDDELVLTLEENVIDEPESVSVNTECEDGEVESEKVVEGQKTEPIIPSIGQVEMDEVYDYENDDTREEGELSANEAMSPIHEVFKKLPVESRKRSWGVSNVFSFSRSNIIANEHVLKDYHIKKRTISKEDLETSDPEDLIFVKEIREENIVHEIESETNNTSFNEKDNDESSLSRNVDNVEVRKKNTLESDKIKDKPNKRHVKNTKSSSSEGKTVLYITNLVRPFTVNQLRELLQRTGKIMEDGFWIDSIKSKCYVQFENEDQAIETRYALHGIRWPVNNPKVLSVHFATQDELLAAQAQTHESEIPRKTEPLVVANHNNDSTQKRIDWKKHFEQYDERPRRIDVREWDIGKPAHPDEMMYEPVDLKKEADVDASGRSKRDKRKRNEASDDESRTKRPRKTADDTQPPVEAKLLDDLFRRTKASPSIYWLPLTDEQIAVKQEARRKHLDDISKQMKRGIERDPRRRDREHHRSRR